MSGTIGQPRITLMRPTGTSSSGFDTTHRSSTVSVRMLQGASLGKNLRIYQYSPLRDSLKKLELELTLWSPMKNSRDISTVEQKEQPL